MPLSHLIHLQKKHTLNRTENFQGTLKKTLIVYVGIIIFIFICKLTSNPIPSKPHSHPCISNSIPFNPVQCNPIQFNPSSVSITIQSKSITSTHPSIHPFNSFKLCARLAQCRPFLPGPPILPNEDLAEIGSNIMSLQSLLSLSLPLLPVPTFHPNPIPSPPHPSERTPIR